MSKMVGGNVGGREFPPVVIYSGNDCVWCVRAKEYMTEHGVAYTEKNVEENDDYAAEALALVSRRGVPIIVIGSEVVRASTSLLSMRYWASVLPLYRAME